MSEKGGTFVLLLQNVSDFLSSKAFMELASRFPAKPRQRHRRHQRRQLEQYPQGAATTGGAQAEDGERALLGGVPTVEAATKAGEQRSGSSCAEVDPGDTVNWEAVRTASHEEVGDSERSRELCGGRSAVGALPSCFEDKAAVRHCVGSSALFADSMPGYIHSLRRVTAQFNLCSYHHTACT